MKLYEIKNEHEFALREMVEAGLDDEIIEDSLAAIKDEFNDKAMSVAAYFRNLDADVVTLENEIKRLTDMKKGIKSGQDSLKEYLRFNMEAMNIDRIDCPLFRITLRKAMRVVAITDENDLPTEYVNSKLIITPDKKKIKDALSNGEKICGAELIDGKRGVMIK